MATSRQVDTSLADRPDFVDIHQAAKVLDLTLDALRKRITRGTVEAVKENGHWRVHIDGNTLDTDRTGLDGDQTSLDDDRTPTGPEVDGAALALAAQDARITSLESQLAAKDDQLQAKDTQIDQLHRLLATTALQAAPARPWWRFWG